MTTETAPAPLPLDLEQLDDDTLLAVLHEANRVYDVRVEAKLPDAVREAVTAALAEVEPGAPAPVSVEFTTTEYDNGHFWDENDAVATLADGFDRTLDLHAHPELGSLLATHSEANDVDDSSMLRVSFNPPRVYLNP